MVPRSTGSYLAGGILILYIYTAWRQLLLLGLLNIDLCSSRLLMVLNRCRVACLLTGGRWLAGRMYT